MMFIPKRNVFFRLLAIILVISVTSMGFPGMLLASDSSNLTGTNTTMAPSTIINILRNNRSSTQLTVDPVVNESNAQAAKAEAKGNRELVKQASNMPDNKSISLIPQTNADLLNQPTTDNSSELSTDETMSNGDFPNSDESNNSNINKLSNNNSNENEPTDSEDDDTYPLK